MGMISESIPKLGCRQWPEATYCIGLTMVPNWGFYYNPLNWLIDQFLCSEIRNNQKHCSKNTQ